MKKTFYLLALILSPILFYGQWNIGIKGGLNLSHAKYLDDADEELIQPYRKLKPGIVCGIYANTFFSKKLGMQIEILYSQKGLKIEQLPFGKSVNSMNYAEMPINAQINLFDNGYVSSALFFGAYSGYWLNGKYKSEDPESGQIQKVKVDFNNEEFSYNRFDYGLTGGIQIQFRILSFYANYTHSMSGSSQINADALTNRVFSLGMFFRVFGD
jgi:hypothetical protein